MNIAYDGHIFAVQVAGGINRYFAEIISRLPGDWNPLLFATPRLGANRPSHPNLRVLDGPTFEPQRISQAVRHFRWRTQVLRRASIIHPTCYDLSDCLSLAQVRRPLVMTVHDMIHAEHRDLFHYADVPVRLQREAVLRADLIVCVSRSTETALHERIPESAGKTRVIYHGASVVASNRGPSTLDQPPRFLYVGGRAAYKNFIFLLGAFARAVETQKDITLTVAGAPLTEEERWLIHLLRIEQNVQAVSYPDESSLAALYCSATALLYPSYHEGFGIPPLEAMSHGTVAVTSNTTSLPEVVGQGGIMLDPTNEDDWVECILSLARGTIERSGLIAKGYAQAGKFSWDESAARHVDLYRQLAP